MKTAITLIVIGSILLIEGGSRITIGFLSGSYGLVVGGMLTGILLGGYLLYKGIKRLAKK